MVAGLTREEVARIAHLARLTLTEDELTLFSRQLAGILEYVEQLRVVDTTDVPPTSHPLSLDAPTRSDDLRPSLVRLRALEEAPEADREHGLFKVPRVLGG